MQEFVDRPLVVGVLAVLGREDLAVGADQEVGGQSEPATGLVGRREPLAASHDLPPAAEHRPDHRTPGTRAEQRARSRLDPELGVQPFVGVGDDREGQVAGVPAQLLGRRVEDHDLTHPRGLDLRVPADDRPQMQMAHRAPGEPSELQVHQTLGVGNGDGTAGDRGDVTSGDGGAGS
jgi:hypothetical protein